MSIDREINARVDAYRNNPKALKDKYSISKEIVDLIALQKIKRGMDAERNSIALAMQTDPNTIKSQLENEVRTRTAQDVAKQLGGVLKNKQAQQQKGLNRLAQRAAAPKGMQGLGALMPQQGQRPQTRMMQAGGIVSFNGEEGSRVSGPPKTQEEQIQYLIDQGLTDEQIRAEVKKLGLLPQAADQIIQQVRSKKRATAPAGPMEELSVTAPKLPLATDPPGMMEEVVVTAPRESQTPAVNPLSTQSMMEQQKGLAQINEQNITTRDVPTAKKEVPSRYYKTTLPHPSETAPTFLEYQRQKGMDRMEQKFMDQGYLSQSEEAFVNKYGPGMDALKAKVGETQAQPPQGKVEGTVVAETPVVPMDNIDRALGLGGQGKQTPPPLQLTQTGIAQGQPRPSGMAERINLQKIFEEMPDAPVPQPTDRTNLDAGGLERLKQLGMDPTAIDVEQAGADALKAAETYYKIADKNEEARTGLEAIINLDKAQTSPEELRYQKLMSFLGGGAGRGRSALAGAGAAAENTRRAQQRDIRARQVERNEMLSEIQRKDNELRQLAKADERSAFDRANRLKIAGLNYLDNAGTAELQARIAEGNRIHDTNLANFRTKMDQVRALLTQQNSIIDESLRRAELTSMDSNRRIMALNAGIDDAMDIQAKISTLIAEATEDAIKEDIEIMSKKSQLGDSELSAEDRNAIATDIRNREEEIIASIQIRFAKEYAKIEDLNDSILQMRDLRQQELLGGVDYNIGAEGEGALSRNLSQ